MYHLWYVLPVFFCFMAHAYKTTCEQCQSGNFYVTPDNGTGYCFSCGYLKKDSTEHKPISRYHDVAALRTRYKELAEYYHSCLDTTHIKYLENRGITEDTIKRVKIGYAPDERHVFYQGEIAQAAGITTKDGYAWLGGRIVFPYWYKGHVTDLRGRVFANKSDRKYLSLRGEGFTRGADYPYGADDLTNDTIVLTEGEVKTLASHIAGYPTVGIPGIRSLKPALSREKHYTVCFDSQKDMSDVYRAIYRIGELFPKISVATLPLTGEKEDIDSYIATYGISAYQRVIQRALPFNQWKQLIRI